MKNRDNRVTRASRWGPTPSDGSSPEIHEPLEESITETRLESLVQHTVQVQVTTRTIKVSRPMTAVSSVSRDYPPPISAHHTSSHRQPERAKRPLAVGSATGITVAAIVFALNLLEVGREHVPAVLQQLNSAPLYLEILGSGVSGLLSGFISGYLTARVQARFSSR